MTSQLTDVTHKNISHRRVLRPGLCTTGTSLPRPTIECNRDIIGVGIVSVVGLFRHWKLHSQLR